MKSLILIGCLLGMSMAIFTDTMREPTKDMFEMWKMQYNKTYDSPREEALRLRNFQNNAEKVMLHNLKYSLGMTTYSKALNKFADQSYEEISSSILKFQPTEAPTTAKKYQAPAGFVAPDSVDWRDAGAVTPVKDQGQCGSCWSFSSTGALEGANFLSEGDLLSLSEQQLVSCDDQSSGCNGGVMIYAFGYWADNGGADSEDDYPYTSGDSGEDGDCLADEFSPVAFDTGYELVDDHDDDALASASASTGPISVMVVANDNFMAYDGGIFYDDSCTDDDINHAILLVGYGSDDDGDFWLIKNSWGDSWGEDGYARIAKGAGNDCGITFQPVYPTVGGKKVDATQFHV